MGGPVKGPDGKLRCPWGTSTPDYLAYHDTEWGKPLATDDQMFERMTLEGFQSGLSWLIILRKRPGFRKAFDNFSIRKVARYGDSDVERLLADVGIVRNRQKIAAAINNAAAVQTLPGGLLEFVHGFAPAKTRPAPKTTADLLATSEESVAMAKALKAHGVRFVGPTTGYALMQATGIVNDHLSRCFVR
jgi:DNA-3-methyladenine glycosylase I